MTLTGCMAMCTAVVSMDMTIANVVLPVMQGSLNANLEQMTWIITSYIVAGAIMTTLAGSLTAPLGRKTVVISSLVGFIVSSALCGLATDLPQMVFFRILQGISGAALVPLSQSIIVDIHDEHNNQQAFVIYSIGAMAGPVIGPVIGGYLTEIANWRWVFFINLPIGAVAIALIWINMPSRRRVRHLKFDLFGFTLLALSIACLQLVLDRGLSKDWFTSTEIVIETMIAIGAFYFFLVHLATGKAPFLDLSLFKSGNYVNGLVVATMVSASMFTPIVLLPPFLQDLQGYSVLDAGILLAPRAAGTMLGVMIAPQLLKYMNARYVCLIGALLIIYSLWCILSFNLEVGPGAVIYTGFVHGAGVGIVFLPITSIAINSLPPELRDQAASFYHLLRNLGSSIGVALGVTVMVVTGDANLVDLYSHFTAFGSGLDHVAGMPLTTENLQGLFLLKMELVRQSKMIGFQNAFIVMILASILAIPFILSFRRPGESGAFSWTQSDLVKRIKLRLLKLRRRKIV